MWWIPGAFAATLTVGPGQDFATIQAAVNAAEDGDEILVESGTYPESVAFNGTNVDLLSVAGSAATTIAPPAGLPALQIIEGESGSVTGFTLTPLTARGIELIDADVEISQIIVVGAGTASLDGGSVRIEGGQPWLDSVDIVASTGLRGGGIYILGGAVATLDKITVSDTTATWGGGMFILDSTVTGTDLELSDLATGYSGGAMYLDGATVDLSWVDIDTVEGDLTWGGGIYLRGGSNLTLSDSEIRDAVVTGPAYDGGGIFAEGASDVTLVRTEVVDCNAEDGGGIAMRGGRLVLTDSLVDGNEAIGKGGGVDLQNTATLTSTGATWVDNEARIGAGVHVGTGSSFVDEGGRFELNDASEDGGAIAVVGATLASLTETAWMGNEADQGGALFVDDMLAEVVLVDLDVQDNEARSGDGGAVHVSNGAVRIDGGDWLRNVAPLGRGGVMATDDAALIVVGGRFEDNTARNGGAFSLRGGSALVDEGRFLRNVAVEDGGGIDVDGVDLQLLRVVMHANEAANAGGAVQVLDSPEAAFTSCIFTENMATEGGGVALFDSAGASLTNVTLAGNTAHDAGAHVFTEGASVRLVNVLAAFGLDGGGFHAEASAVTGSDRFHNLVWANAGGDWSGAWTDVTGTSGNLAADPMLRAYDIDGDETDDDLRLAAGSPAINTGDPSLFDVDGSAGDIGAWGGPAAWPWDRDGDGFFAHADCDDSDVSAYPGAPEVPYDGIDQDCDGEDTNDLDEDGFAGGDGPDCDDEDPDVNPDGIEIYYDGIDQDCDGKSDYDQDGDQHDHLAYGGDDCNDEDPAINPSIIEVYYDGVDADCGGDSDYDADQDGRDAEAYGGADCDDTDAATFPGAVEICDLADNDCDELVDEDPIDPLAWFVDQDGDEYGNPDVWELACFEGPGRSANGDDCDDENPLVNPGVSEIWYDGIDQDCDRRDDDRDGDGFGHADDCDDLRAEAYPGAEELRNDLDDDCDGWAESDDRDDDGLMDWDEWQLGTDDSNPDTDGDTVLDGEELPHAQPVDTDGDGYIDALDTDDDDDDLPTAYERSVDADLDGKRDLDIDRDRIPNHLDSDSDGDGYSDLEEGRGDRDGDTVPDFADYTGGFAGGGCGGGQSSVGTLLLLLPLLWRRRALVALGLLPGVAAAQDPDAAPDDVMDAHAFEILGTSGDTRGHQRVLEGGANRKGVTAGVVVDLANKPLTERLPWGDEPVVRGLLTATPYLAVSPLERLRVDATLPVHAMGWGPNQRFTTAGDLRLGVAYDVLPQHGRVPGITVLGTGWVPTGAEASFVGLPTAAVGGVAALSQRMGAFGWTVNAGARWAPMTDVREGQVGAGLLGGAGLQLAPWERVGLVAELAVDGTRGLTDVPLETGGGIRVQGEKGKFWNVMATTGLTDQPGVPSWRVAVAGGFGKAPVDPDPVTIRVGPRPPDPEPEVITVSDAQPLAELVDDRIVIREAIFFKEGSAVLLGRSNKVLEAVQQVLEDHPEVALLFVQGHTNANGPANYNQTLSETRAASVVAWFIKKGVPADKLVSKGYGFSNPLVPHGAEDAVVVNRRVEFLVLRADRKKDGDVLVPEGLE